MELKLDVSRILILDSPFDAEMLDNNQAVLGEFEGETVLLVKVDYEEINSQVRKQSNSKKNS